MYVSADSRHETDCSPTSIQEWSSTASEREVEPRHAELAKDIVDMCCDGADDHSQHVRLRAFLVL
jgi:hypothetical protein